MDPDPIHNIGAYLRLSSDIPLFELFQIFLYHKIFMYRTFCTLQTSGDLANGSEDDDDADDDDDDEDDGDDDEEGEYEDSVMEVQPDIIVGGEEDNNQVLQLDFNF